MTLTPLILQLTTLAEVTSMTSDKRGFGDFTKSVYAET